MAGKCEDLEDLTDVQIVLRGCRSCGHFKPYVLGCKNHKAPGAKA